MRRIVTILAILTVALMVAACAPKEAPSAPQPAPQPAVEPTPEPEPEPEPVVVEPEPVKDETAYVKEGEVENKFAPSGEKCSAADDGNFTGALLDRPSSVCCTEELGIPAFLSGEKCLPTG